MRCSCAPKSVAKGAGYPREATRCGESRCFTSLRSSRRDPAGYQLVEKSMRVLPFLTIYGGTLALIACVILRYRWGVLMSMMLYSCFMPGPFWPSKMLCLRFMSACELVVGGAWGMLMVWMNVRNASWPSFSLFQPLFRPLETSREL